MEIRRATGEKSRSTSAWDLVGPVLCGLGALSMLIAALFVDLDSTGAKAFIVAAGASFVPGAILTLVTVRRRVGPPR